MEYRTLKRDVDKVKAGYKVGSDRSLIATVPSKVIFPERFLEKELASIGARNYVVGAFAHIVEGGYYANFTAVCMVELKPSSIGTFKVGDETYMEMNFEPGDTVMVAQEAIEDMILPYRIYDEMISKGHWPFYMNYLDRIKLLFSANKLAGVDLLSNHAMLELNAAAISRDPKDVTQYFRHVVKTQADAYETIPLSIPLMSVPRGTTNAVSRLMGSNIKQGLNAELANPTTKLENVEQLLRL